MIIMSDENAAEIRHINKNIESMSAAVGNLANSVNELVIQERVRAERDASMDIRVTKVEDKMGSNQPYIDWVGAIKRIFDSVLVKWGIPIFCIGILAVAAKAVGIPVFGG